MSPRLLIALLLLLGIAIEGWRDYSLVRSGGDTCRATGLGCGAHGRPSD